MTEGYPDPPTAVASVRPCALAEALAAGEPVRLLDVWDRDEAETWRVEGPTVTHTQVPYARFMTAQVHDGVGGLAAEVAGEGPVTVVCGRGEASAYVAGLLTEAGVEARNLAGGMAAWGEVQLARAVHEGATTVVQYERPATGCLSYAVLAGGETLLVDPLWAHVKDYRADLHERGAELVAAVDTHVHADHLSGVRALTGGDGPRRLFPAGVDDRGVTDGERLADGATLTVGGVAVEAVALPGHTTEMTGLLVEGVLLAGDSLFLDAVARPDLQEGVDPRDQAAALHETVTDRLAGLLADTLLAPGHRRPDTRPGERGYVAPLSTVRGRVGALGLDRGAFVERVLVDAPRPRNAERILAVNRGEESFPEGGPALDLGPNSCAAGMY